MLRGCRDILGVALNSKDPGLEGRPRSFAKVLIILITVSSDRDVALLAEQLYQEPTGLSSDTSPNC